MTVALIIISMITLGYKSLSYGSVNDLFKYKKLNRTVLKLVYSNGNRLCLNNLSKTTCFHLNLKHIHSSKVVVIAFDRKQLETFNLSELVFHCDNKRISLRKFRTIDNCKNIAALTKRQTKILTQYPVDRIYIRDHINGQEYVFRITPITRELFYQ